MPAEETGLWRLSELATSAVLLKGENARRGMKDESKEREKERERDYGQGGRLGGYLEPDDQSGNSI